MTVTRVGGRLLLVLIVAALALIVAIPTLGLLPASERPPEATSSATAATAAVATIAAADTSSPAPTASTSRIVRHPAVVARVPDCQNPLGWDYTVSGNDLFVVCDAQPSTSSDAPSTGPYVARVDLTTNRVTAIYRYGRPMTYIQSLSVLNDSLWFETTGPGSACVGSGCDGFFRLERFDIATGKNTLDLPNVGLAGSGLGYIWVRDINPAADATNRPARMLDPRTGEEKGQMPDLADGQAFACGSMWLLATTNEMTDAPTTSFERIDPTTSSVVARFAIPGIYPNLASIGNECWGSVSPGGSDFDISGYADHFVRIGNAGVEFSSPRLSVGVSRDSSGDGAWESRVDIKGGSFWLVGDDLGETATLRKIDSLTWEPSGTIWRVDASGYPGDPFAIIGGSVWAYGDAGGIVRLDIPVD